MQLPFTFTDLINCVKRTFLKPQRKGADEAIRRLFDEIKKVMKEGSEIRIKDFGVFSVKDIPAREGRNPRTGKPISLKSSKWVSFRSYKALKKTLNE